MCNEYFFNKKPNILFLSIDSPTDNAQRGTTVILTTAKINEAAKAAAAVCASKVRSRIDDFEHRCRGKTSPAPGSADAVHRRHKNGDMESTSSSNNNANAKTAPTTKTTQADTLIKPTVQQPKVELSDHIQFRITEVVKEGDVATKAKKKSDETSDEAHILSDGEFYSWCCFILSIMLLVAYYSVVIALTIFVYNMTVFFHNV